jgi:hypothetical protein
MTSSGSPLLEQLEDRQLLSTVVLGITPGVSVWKLYATTGGGGNLASFDITFGGAASGTTVVSSPVRPASNGGGLSDVIGFHPNPGPGTSPGSNQQGGQTSTTPPQSQPGHRWNFSDELAGAVGFRCIDLVKSTIPVVTPVRGANARIPVPTMRLPSPG